MPVDRGLAPVEQALPVTFAEKLFEDVEAVIRRSH
jgi:hypothetical protein